MIDPTGFLSARDVIIGHVMQVVHANPRYDLELLASFEDGLAEMESQVVAMLAGSHPRARSIGAIVEDPGYHARLLEYVRAFRRDPAARAPGRGHVSAPGPPSRLERGCGGALWTLAGAGTSGGAGGEDAGGARRGTTRVGSGAEMSK